MGAAGALLIPATRNSNLQEPHNFLRDEPVRGTLPSCPRKCAW